MIFDVQIPMLRVEGGSIVRQLEVASVFNRHKIELHDFRLAKTQPGWWSVKAIFASSGHRTTAVEAFSAVMQTLGGALGGAEILWEVDRADPDE